ncbi:hypothetical protein SAMN06296020_10318 [Anoxynatronum buryatiense]|uniref:PurE domain-containing protein n=2 Tax=Anoxynatronum buryatiense TaxID=489973 RepID=A0AA45WUF8_9CLOT|nr:nickel pincer cofactor biosynthesis protein LarB [Anoxynatronum buryatiense]SMP46496.1 hypothetical protein SAMN06296020_10318 [Anoxynatronum buryatiense]
MREEDVRKMLEEVQAGILTVDQAAEQLKELPFSDLGFATVDHHREIRTGYPEVIYGEGKTAEQVTGIVKSMLKRESNVLITRTNRNVHDSIRSLDDRARFNPVAKTIALCRRKITFSDGYVAIVAAGTSDLPVAEEAFETARMMGSRVEMVMDVGVAGIHRLFAKMDVIRKAKVVIVVAGMEGALASVVGGLVDKPVIAVPTSVGYGTGFGGVAALLTMLNSCASGVTVVNIDNGFGAAYSASLINRISSEKAHG